MLNSAIISFCAVTTTGQYNAPCRSSLQATAMQTGFDIPVNNGEKIIIHAADADAKDTLGMNGYYTVGGVVFVAGAIKNRGASFNLPNLGIANSISAHLGLDSCNVGLGWTFK